MPGPIYSASVSQYWKTVSNQEVILKRLISMLPIAQKLYVGVKSDLCEMYKLSNVAKDIGVLDKVYTGKISCKKELLKDLQILTFNTVLFSII